MILISVVGVVSERISHIRLFKRVVYLLSRAQRFTLVLITAHEIGIFMFSFQVSHYALFAALTHQGVASRCRNRIKVYQLVI